MTFAPRQVRLVILAVLVIGMSAWPASAWQAKRAVRVEGGAVQVIDGAALPPGAQPAPGQPNPSAKPSEAKPGDPNKPADGAKPGEGDKKKDGPSPVTTRPAQPRTPPNPDELKKLKPDEDGRVKFNLKGQPWPDVLEWLGEVSQKSLDWQELPNDYLNLVTQQSYSINEARDLLNRHLLARGFTMLTKGETISVVNVTKINPGMVPRVEPNELASLPDHDFVKTSLPLAWLLADQAETELKPMLSPNGKLTHLTNTNRLEAMDSVKNLREIWAVIQEEQSGGKQEELVREFKLKHTKAVEVLDQLHTLLGINKPNTRTKRNGSGGGSGGGMDPNMMMQFQQQMQQMMQQMQQGMQQAKPGGGAAPKPGEVRLLANERENSILATAPPDKMAIVAQAVKTLDVISSRESLLQNVQRMQVYRLSGLDPQTLVELLEEVGNLDPTTKLQIDSKNKSIVAHASLADHLTIKMLVEKLDGTGRKFQVIPLRRLEADYVAGTIEFMMAGGEKEKNQTRSNPFYFDFGYNPYGMRNSPQTDNNDKFRVDADVENNRLLLWANEIELREIENLLMKLGEIAPPGGNRNTQRYLENLDPEDADQLLERIRRIWPSISPNELIIDDAGSARRLSPSQPNPTESPETSAPNGESATEKPAKKTKTPKGTIPPKEAPAARAVTPPKAREVLLAIADGDEQESNQPIANGDDQPAPPSKRFEPRKRSEPVESRPHAPIRIRRTPDGQLVLESQDTEALDRLEDLMHEAAPPKRDYKVFYLKYPSTWAYSVELSLKEFFEVEKKKNGSEYNPYFGFRMDTGDKTAARRLSKRKSLKIISDSDSGTILVQGATPEQLKTIDDLIKIYDQPPSTDGKQVRKTQVFTLKFSKAAVIGETIKDVYRDLLSTNDKAYQNQQQNKEGQKTAAPDRSYTFIYGDVGGDDKAKQQETPVKFKGLVSLGVDEISNTIIVSAPDSLLQNISDLIDQLDRAAKPTNSVQVVKLDSKVNSADLQKRLAKIFTKPQPKQQPQQRPQQPQQPQHQPELPAGEP